MGGILPLALWTTLLGFGMQPLVSVWQVHSKGTHLQSNLLPTPLMVPTLSLGLMTVLSKCGGYKTLFSLVIYMRRIVGFDLLMVLALARLLLGTCIPSICLLISWSFLLTILTNLMLTVLCLGNPGSLVGDDSQVDVNYIYCECCTIVYYPT